MQFVEYVEKLSNVDDYVVDVMRIKVIKINIIIQ